MGFFILPLGLTAGVFLGLWLIQVWEDQLKRQSRLPRDLGPAEYKEHVQKLLRELKSLEESAEIDPEEAHARADGILLELIDHPEVTEAFQRIKKWYS